MKASNIGPRVRPPEKRSFKVNELDPTFFTTLVPWRDHSRSWSQCCSHILLDSIPVDRAIDLVASHWDSSVAKVVPLECLASSSVC